jgi:hypothetical protein
MKLDDMENNIKANMVDIEEIKKELESLKIRIADQHLQVFTKDGRSRIEPLEQHVHHKHDQPPLVYKLEKNVFVPTKIKHWDKSGIFNELRGNLNSPQNPKSYHIDGLGSFDYPKDINDNVRAEDDLKDGKGEPPAKHTFFIAPTGDPREGVYPASSPPGQPSPAGNEPGIGCDKHNWDYSDPCPFCELESKKRQFNDYKKNSKESHDEIVKELREQLEKEKRICNEYSQKNDKLREQLRDVRSKLDASQGLNTLLLDDDTKALIKRYEEQLAGLEKKDCPKCAIIEDRATQEVQKMKEQLDDPQALTLSTAPLTIINKTEAVELINEVKKLKEQLESQRPTLLQKRVEVLETAVKLKDEQLAAKVEKIEQLEKQASHHFCKDLIKAIEKERDGLQLKVGKYEAIERIIDYGDIPSLPTEMEKKILKLIEDKGKWEGFEDVYNYIHNNAHKPGTPLVEIIKEWRESRDGYKEKWEQHEKLLLNHHPEELIEMKKSLDAIITELEEIGEGTMFYIFARNLLKKATSYAVDSADRQEEKNDDE